MDCTDPPVGIATAAEADARPTLRVKCVPHRSLNGPGWYIRAPVVPHFIEAIGTPVGPCFLTVGFCGGARHDK